MTKLNLPYPVSKLCNFLTSSLTFVRVLNNLAIEHTELYMPG